MTTSSSRRGLRRRLGHWTKHTSRHDKQRRQFRPLVEQLEDRRLLAAAFSEFVDPHPEPGNGFGYRVSPTSTGNVVIAAPYDDAGGPDAGAVYLFNGATGALISTLTGSSPNDRIGGPDGFVEILSNGNYLVISPRWDNGSATDAGAVTFGNGVTGVSGVVSAANSLVGTHKNDLFNARVMVARSADQRQLVYNFPIGTTARRRMRGR